LIWGLKSTVFLIRDLKRKNQKHFGFSGKSSRSKWRKGIIKKGAESDLLGKAFEDHQSTSFDCIRLIVLNQPGFNSFSHFINQSRRK